MRASFLATVLGIAETDTSEYAGGAHAVAFYVTGKAPIGEAYRKVTLPLFDMKQARELATAYHESDAVRITVETVDGDAGAVCCSRAEINTPAALMPHQDHDGTIRWEIRLGSDSRAQVDFCPWCGSRLPDKVIR
jgi:hypothetical protein